MFSIDVNTDVNLNLISMNAQGVLVTMRKNVELANLLRKDILAGKYGTEGGLPGANELARRSGYARNTVNSALALLEGEKLIIKRDAAFYVNSIPVTMTQYAPPTHVRYSDGYTTNLEAVGDYTLPEHLAEKLNVPQCAVYRMQLSGETVNGERHPLQLSQRYYFFPLGQGDLQRMKDDASFDPMWSNFPGTLVSRDEITARFATQEEAARLNLAEVAPVLSVWESTRDKDGAILMVQETTLSPRFALIFEFPFENSPKK